MTTPEFTKAYTWIYPPMVGSDYVGVLKMESLHMGMREHWGIERGWSGTTFTIILPEKGSPDLQDKE